MGVVDGDDRTDGERHEGAVAKAELGLAVHEKSFDMVRYELPRRGGSAYGARRSQRAVRRRDARQISNGLKLIRTVSTAQLVIAGWVCPSS
jgi:hypothetical protein